MQTNDSTNHSNSNRRERLNEILRFGIVGVTATAIQYGVYALLLMLISPTPAMTIGYIVSFAFNFIATTRFTFRVEANARHGAGFIAAHAVNYVLQMVTLNLFIHLGVSKHWAPIPMFAICVPVNFLLVKVLHEEIKHERRDITITPMCIKTTPVALQKRLYRISTKALSEADMGFIAP